MLIVSLACFQVAYAIGVAHPPSISLFFLLKSEKELLQIVNKNSDPRPGVIVRSAFWSRDTAPAVLGLCGIVVVFNLYYLCGAAETWTWGDRSTRRPPAMDTGRCQRTSACRVSAYQRAWMRCLDKCPWCCCDPGRRQLGGGYVGRGQGGCRWMVSSVIYDFVASR